MSEFIVAEVSKSWVNGKDVCGPTEGLLLSECFERIIEANRQRGYLLHFFSLCHTVVNPECLNETIIAVFRAQAGGAA